MSCARDYKADAWGDHAQPLKGPAPGSGHLGRSTVLAGDCYHAPEMCRENGGYDNDCCAIPETAACAMGHQYVRKELGCGMNTGGWLEGLGVYG